MKQGKLQKPIIIVAFIAACFATFILGRDLFPRIISATYQTPNKLTYGSENFTTSQTCPSANPDYRTMHSLSSSDGAITIGNINNPLRISFISYYSPQSVSDLLAGVGYMSYGCQPLDSTFTPYLQIIFYKSYPVHEYGGVFDTPCTLLTAPLPTISNPDIEPITINGYQACESIRPDGNSYAVVGNGRAAIFHIGNIQSTFNPSNYFTYTINGKNMVPYFNAVINSIHFER